MINVLVMRVNGRTEHAPQMQQLFTKYGNCIKARLGLHETGDANSDDGLLILHLCGTDEEIKALCAEMEGIEGVTAKLVTL